MYYLLVSSFINKLIYFDMCSRSIFLRNFALTTHNPHTPSTEDIASNSKRIKWSCQESKLLHYPLLLTYLRSYNYLSSKLYPFLQCHMKKCSFYSGHILVLVSLLPPHSKAPSVFLFPNTESLFAFLHGLPVPLFRLLPMAFKHVQVRSNYHPIWGHQCQVITEATPYCALPLVLSPWPYLKGPGKKRKKEEKEESRGRCESRERRQTVLDLSPLCRCLKLRLTQSRKTERS